jgi:hypothetical protein
MFPIGRFWRKLRAHGSQPDDAAQRIPKVQIARDHVRSIDPTIEVVRYIGSPPQPEVIDAVLTNDVGCTDQHHSRLAISDLALRYLVPAIEIVGSHSKRNKALLPARQTVQLVRFLAADSLPSLPPHH